MKTILFSLCLLIFSYSSAFCQLPNGGMETWVNDGFGFQIPAGGWEASNITGYPAQVVKSTGYTGSFAAKLRTVDVGGSEQGGILGINNLPINGTPISLQGYYKVHVTGPFDAFVAILDVFDSLGNNISNSYFDTEEGISIDTWTPFLFFFAPCSDIPHTVEILLFIGSFSLDSYAELDDLKLNFLDNVDEFTNTLSAFSVYPTVNSGELKIKFSLTKNTLLKLEIYNLLGSKVAEVLSDNFSFGNHTTTIHTDLNDGMYLLRASAEGGDRTIKFAMQHK